MIGFTKEMGPSCLGVVSFWPLVGRENVHFLRTKRPPGKTCLIREREARFTSEELLKTRARTETRAEKDSEGAAEEQQKRSKRAEKES